MAQHLLFSEHMTAKEVHLPIAETYLGQAHIAGTGPEGRTCRECRQKKKEQLAELRREAR